MWPFRSRRPSITSPPTWNLAEPLLRFSPKDHWTIGDACQGTQIWGATGSGKSTGSLAWIVNAFLRHGFGGVFLTVKSTDRETYEGYCRAAGRLDDLILFGPDHAARFNFIEAELQRTDRGAGQVENLVRMFNTILEISERQQNGSGRSEEVYWRRANQQLLRNALEVLMQAERRITTRNLHRFVVSAATSDEQLKSEAWKQESYCFECMQEADARSSGSRRDDLRLATDFFCVEWPQLSEKTRSIILSTLTSMLDVLNRGVLRELLSPEVTNVRPEMACDGKIFLIDMPLKLFGEVGLVAQTALKYCFQQAMERRDISTNSRPVFLVVDESHLLTTASDQMFQTTARSSRTAVVYATQSLTNYLAALGGDRAEPEVHSLLGNLQTQFFHQQLDTRTNTYAAELIGRTKQHFLNSSQSHAPVDWLDVIVGGSSAASGTAGMSEQYEFEVQPSVFTGLRQGGPPDWLVDAIVVRGGRRFQATGRPWMPLSIRQHV